jgi:adenine-specific DNA-methyltransferase
MTKDIFQFLKTYSTDTVLINRLIVSSYLSVNGISVTNNKLIKKYLIHRNNKDEYEHLVNFNDLVLKEGRRFDLENLIELFEFVISPSDKIINGAVYTPRFIREYIIDHAFEKRRKDLKSIKCIDLSCGCGGFLLTAARVLKKRTKLDYFDIYKHNLFGLDITKYSIERSSLLLTLNAIENGEDLANFEFNFHIGNALSFDRKKTFSQAELGFDCVIGNPPYVCSRNMENDTKELTKNWSVSRSGHPDLYIPFFQIGFENLAEDGVLGYITVNTFTKSVNGRALREYFSEKQPAFKIINFGGEQVFKQRNTYTCICIIENKIGCLQYKLTGSKHLNDLGEDDYSNYAYVDLNDLQGWNLVNSQTTLSIINKIENTGIQFGEKYTTRNGIATLKNEVYKFTPVKKDKKYFYLDFNGIIHKIEKALCRDIVNSNKIKSSDDLKQKKEKIIFPYIQGKEDTLIIDEAVLKKKYPNAYQYLLSHKKLLAGRDKGEGEYEAWYAYGRRQSLDIKAYKLFFPHICERPTFVLCKDQNLLFYNGIAVISNDLKELTLLKKILESELFFTYIKNTTKNYASGYLSLSRNYLKNFGIYNFSEQQKEHLIKLTKRSAIDRFLDSLYTIDNPDHENLQPRPLKLKKKKNALVEA